MSWSNCIIEALRAARRDGWRGYIKIRQSRCGVLFHVMYEYANGEVANFVPDENAPRLPFPPPVFDGHMVHHDNAWKAQVLLSDLGVDKSELKHMSDDEIITIASRITVETHHEE